MFFLCCDESFLGRATLKYSGALLDCSEVVGAMVNEGAKGEETAQRQQEERKKYRAGTSVTLFLHCCCWSAAGAPLTLNRSTSLETVSELARRAGDLLSPFRRYLSRRILFYIWASPTCIVLHAARVVVFSPSSDGWQEGWSIYG